MVHTRAWPRISPSTKIYFRCHFRGFSNPIVNLHKRIIMSLKGLTDIIIYFKWHDITHVISWCIFIGNAVFKRPISPTISFLLCQIEGPLFDTGVFLRCSFCSCSGWPQVAWHLHNPNGIICSLSVSPLVPDSVAAIGNKCLHFFAIALFCFVYLNTATSLALQLQQERIRMVRSSKKARKRLARIERHSHCNQ